MALGKAAGKLRRPQQERAYRTRHALIEAGEREFSERGYAATTSKSIAARADVSVGTFYQYFADKDALLREIAQTRRAGVAVKLAVLEMAPPTGDRDALADQIAAHLRDVAAAVMDLHRGDPGLHAVLTERRHVDPELDRLTSGAETALVARIAALLERWGHHEDPLATAYILFGMVEGSIHAHCLGAQLVDDDRFITALVHALVRLALPWPMPAAQ